uniref:Protein phosphatase 1 regulatory subunit n=1 Tax=Clastoptera arizonana TaxID=38151 RepID=A0A1B6CAT6_9HEMI
MCSVAAMHSDYDVLLSHSPPVFSHSPPSYYSSCRLSNSPVAHQRSSPNQIRRSVPLKSLPSTVKSEKVPRRPCLVLRPDDSSSSGDDSDLPSPTRLKKKVVFADDRGFSLTQVRMMTEPSNMPPKWNSQFLMLVTKGVPAEVAATPWEITFSQPASDYLEFRRRLEEGNVSLENVIVRESEETILGTVKVKNLTFHKEVFVRSSVDGWLTNEDTFCTYVPGNTSPALSAPSSIKVIYDTFSFRLTLPPMSSKVEFCVCYRCSGTEHWDNNFGKNYTLTKKGSITRTEPVPVPITRFSDAVHAKMESWSEFGSWKHLTNDGPYW